MNVVFHDDHSTQTGRIFYGFGTVVAELVNCDLHVISVVRKSAFKAEDTREWLSLIYCRDAN